MCHVNNQNNPDSTNFYQNYRQRRITLAILNLIWFKIDNPDFEFVIC